MLPKNNMEFWRHSAIFFAADLLKRLGLHLLGILIFPDRFLDEPMAHGTKIIQSGNLNDLFLNVFGYFKAALVDRTLNYACRRGYSADTHWPLVIDLIRGVLRDKAQTLENK